MDDDIVSDLADLSSIPLRDLFTSTDPAILASLDRVTRQILGAEDSRDGPCTPDTCGY